MDYYKLSVLRKVEHGADWETIYIQVDEGKPKIMLHDSPIGHPLNSKIESVTKEEFQKVWNDSRADFGH